MGYRTTTRFRGAVTAAGLFLAPGTAAHRPVHEVQVVASKFRFEPAVIEVTAGEPVRLVIRSRDVVHGFAVPTLNIDVQLPQKRGEPAMDR